MNSFTYLPTYLLIYLLTNFSTYLFVHLLSKDFQYTIALLYLYPCLQNFDLFIYQHGQRFICWFIFYLAYFLTDVFFSIHDLVRSLFLYYFSSLLLLFYSFFFPELIYFLTYLFMFLFVELIVFFRTIRLFISFPAYLFVNLHFCYIFALIHNFYFIICWFIYWFVH